MDIDGAQTINDPGEHLSLNAGLPNPEDEVAEDAKQHQHLQNDDLFHDPIEPGEVPDVKAEIATIEQGTRSLEALQYLIEDVRRSHGMSQTYALEAERICPGMLGVPTGYFTKAPSATRYKVTLEGLLAKVWDYIRQGLEKLKVLVVRFIYWVAGKEYPGDSRANPKEAVKDFERESQKLDQAMEQGAQKVADTATTLANETKQGVQFKRDKVGGAHAMGDSTQQLGEAGEKVIQWSDLDRIIGELLGREPLVAELMLGKDAFFSDLIHNGPYGTLMQQLRAPFAATLNAMVERMELLRVAVDQLAQMHEGDPDPVSPHTYKELSSVVPMRIMNRDVHPGQVLAKLKEGQADLTSRDAQPMAFELVFGRLTQSYRHSAFKDLSRFTAGSLETMTDVTAKYQKIHEALGTMPSDHNVEIQADWSKIMLSFNEEYAAVLGIVTEYKNYHTSMKNLTLRAMRFGYLVAEKMEHAMAPEQTNPKILAVVKQLQKEAAEVIKRVNEGGKYRVPGVF